MSYIEVQYPAEKAAFYKLLKEQVALYTGEESAQTAVLANAASVLAQAFPEANWVGFYLIEGEELVLGPFQGKPAVSRIGYGKGVCGTAWREDRSQVVEEVSCFAGHIACDCNTHSEIVIPLRRADGRMWGVLDMDSVLPGHFTEADRAGLEDIVPLLDRGEGENPVLRALHERKSVRAYTGEPVTGAEKEAILAAACAAPTAGNQQLYTILDITDQAVKDALAVSCDNQPFIAKASAVFVFCADCQKWYDAFRSGGCDPRLPGAGDLMLAVTDCAIAAQNAVTAAESLGLGSCYIGDIMERCEVHRELLHLPDYVFPAVMLVIGRPTRQQRERPKPRRCALEHIVHENAYRVMDGGELREMLAYQAGERPYEEWLAAFCARKYQSDFSREMTRSVEAYLKAFGGER